MSDAVHQWLAAQRELIERWLAAPAEGAPEDAARRFWEPLMQILSPEARELARQLAELGPGFLAGTHDALLDLFGARESGNAPPGHWLALAPIGYFREQQTHVQELTRALAEYQRITAQLAAVITKVHAEALESLAKKVAALSQAGDPISDTRRLYDLWIECGEAAFAAQARSEVFGKLQGEWVNASVRVRMAQQTIAEKFLQSLDLPTRAELNSVHQRLKDLRERIERLEAESSADRVSRSESR